MDNTPAINFKSYYDEPYVEVRSLIMWLEKEALNCYKSDQKIPAAVLESVADSLRPAIDRYQ